MSDDLQINFPSEEELKEIKDRGNTLMAKVIKGNSILWPDAIDKAETEGVQKEDYELAAKLRDVRKQD